MQRVELSVELTDGEIKRIAEKEAAMGLNQGQIYLLALITGFQALGLDISNVDPLTLIADDI